MIELNVDVGVFEFMNTVCDDINMSTYSPIGFTLLLVLHICLQIDRVHDTFISTYCYQMSEW